MRFVRTPCQWAPIAAQDGRHHGREDPHLRVGRAGRGRPGGFGRSAPLHLARRCKPSCAWTAVYSGFSAELTLLVSSADKPEYTAVAGRPAPRRRRGARGRGGGRGPSPRRSLSDALRAGHALPLAAARRHSAWLRNRPPPPRTHSHTRSNTVSVLGKCHKNRNRRVAARPRLRESWWARGRVRAPLEARAGAAAGRAPSLAPRSLHANSGVPPSCPAELDARGPRRQPPCAAPANRTPARRPGGRPLFPGAIDSDARPGRRLASDRLRHVSSLSLSLALSLVSSLSSSKSRSAAMPREGRGGGGGNAHRLFTPRSRATKLLEPTPQGRQPPPHCTIPARGGGRGFWPTKYQLGTYTFGQAKQAA